MYSMRLCAQLAVILQQGVLQPPCEKQGIIKSLPSCAVNSVESDGKYNDVI